MKDDQVVLSLTRRALRRLVLILALIALWFGAPYLQAQKVQDNYSDKFKLATDVGGVAIATSSDGQYVYLAGQRGVIVSDDFGKTGSWVQTLRMK